MGYVKKTITEAIGETSVTTIIEFEIYEDFMAYEKSLNASQAGFVMDSPLKIVINETNKDGVEILNRYPEAYCGWCWQDQVEKFQVLKYRISEERK